MIFLAVLFLVLGFMILKGRAQVEAPAGKAAGGAMGGLLMLFGIGALLSSCVQVVPAGNVGVVSLFGKISPVPLPEGISLRNPFATVIVVSVRTQEYTMSSVMREGQVEGDDSIRVLSKDTLPLNADVTLVYRPVPKYVPWLYRTVGDEDDLVRKIVRPASRAAFRNAVASFTALEVLSSKREALAVDITQKFTETVNGILSKNDNYPGEAFIIQQVLVRNIEPPQKLKDSIESKLIAEQDAQRMEYVLQKEKQEAERKRIEAKGIADFQAIVSQGLTEKLLQWKGIEATLDLSKSPNSKVVVVGGKDGLPLILNTDQIASK